MKLVFKGRDGQSYTQYETFVTKKEEFKTEINIGSSKNSFFS